MSPRESAGKLRIMLADEFRRAGVDAPTLCEGWRSQHLLAHLVLREHEPWRLAGLAIPMLAGRANAAVFAAAAVTDHQFATMTDRFEAGPGRLSPWRLADGVANVLEYAVHLADLVEADGTTRLDLPAAIAEDVWAQLRQRAGYLYRGTPVRIVIVIDRRDGGGRTVTRRYRQGQDTIVVRGRLVDVLMHAYGRPAPGVNISGDEEAVSLFRTSQRAV